MEQDFQADQQVLVKLPAVKGKLSPRWSQPRRIKRMIGPYAAQMEDGSRWNVSRLRPAPEEEERISGETSLRIFLLVLHLQRGLEMRHKSNSAGIRFASVARRDT